MLDSIWTHSTCILKRKAAQKRFVRQEIKFFTFMPVKMTVEFLATARADGCGRCGFCKGTVVRELQEAGHRVVVCGDGTSDRCAADAADFVFATRRLVDHCRERALPHLPFADFHEVMARFPGAP